MGFAIMYILVLSLKSAYSKMSCAKTQKKSMPLLRLSSTTAISMYTLKSKFLAENQYREQKNSVCVIMCTF